MIKSFAPLVDLNSRILVLGTMPGIASLEKGQYYAHPRNQFWPLIYEIFEAKPDILYSQRKAFLLEQGIAVWDVVKNCYRKGSLDANITSPQPNNVAGLLYGYPSIKHVFFNGAQAASYYKKVIRPQVESLELKHTRLPSTSPAHTMAYTCKLQQWKAIAHTLGHKKGSGN